MASRRVSVALAAGLLLWTAAASAQTQDRIRGSVIGYGGASITDITSPQVGGLVGVNLSRDLQITGDFVWTKDVQPNFLRDDLKALEDGMQQEMQNSGITGMSFTATSKVPTFALQGGLRYLVPTNGAVRPYIGGAGGFMHLSPDPKLTLGGVDVTSEFDNEADFQAAFKNENRPMMSFGGGVAMIFAQHFSMDIGYKYSRVFIKDTYLQDPASPHQHTGINLHQLVFGAGFAF